MCQVLRWMFHYAYQFFDAHDNSYKVSRIVIPILEGLKLKLTE